MNRGGDVLSLVEVEVLVMEWELEGCCFSLILVCLAGVERLKKQIFRVLCREQSCRFEKHQCMGYWGESRIART